jgi:hypothetical protein
MNQPAKPVYRFGPFRYDSGQRLLFRENETVPLAPKVGETLRVLLERHGLVVEKADLMREIWPDTTVEEIGLARNISQLRKALGDEDDTGKYIETLPSGDTGLQESLRWEEWRTVLRPVRSPHWAGLAGFCWLRRLFARSWVLSMCSFTGHRVTFRRAEPSPTLPSCRLNA